MTATIDLPSGHLDFLKALSRPTDYQKLLIELYEKTDRTATEDKKLSALIRTEKATIRANKAKQDMQNLLNAERTKEKAGGGRRAEGRAGSSAARVAGGRAS